MHMVRYFGVLAPHSEHRAAVVPKPPPITAEQLPLFTPGDVPLATPARASSRIAWAQLLKRVFKTDISICGHCGGNVRVTEAVTERAEIRKRLDALGVPSEPPGLHPARAPPQGDFDWDCVS